MENTNRPGHKNIDSEMTRTASGLSILIPGSAATSIEKTPFYKETGENAPHAPADEQPQHAQEEKEGHLKIFCHVCQQKLDVSGLSPFAHFNCPACNAELIVPKWFDNYLLEEPAGTGGMATVYRALDPALDREVAIKILSPEVASAKERSELFLHEARTAATINHYAIIPIYTCGIFEGQPYIVMQYLGGGTLELKIKMERKGLPLKQTIKWIRDIADGLDNAKRHGIIHHDVKPGNIMLDSDGNAKIGDFGIAQAVNDARTTKIFELTKAWISPHYVSPEKVIEGKEDQRGDIYSLGASFYHLLTGSTPFENDDVTELIRMRIRKDPVSPSEYDPSIPKDISDLIMSMMDRDPDKRPTYRDIVKKLTDFPKKSRTVRTNPAPAFSQTSKRPDKTLTQASPKGSPLFKIAFAIFIAALVAAAAWGISTGTFKKLLNGNNQPTETNEQTAPQTLDYLPETTALFSKGKSRTAKETAELAFNNPDSTLEARKQAAIQLALSVYLNMSAQPNDECSFIIERLATLDIPETDNHIIILRFLERHEIQPEVLFSRLESDQRMRSIGYLAAFLKSVYNKDELADTIKYFSLFSSSSEGLPKEYWGLAWNSRLKAWSNYLSSGSPAPGETLEPLMMRRQGNKRLPAAAYENKDVSVISPAWFEKNREFAKNRPALSEFRVSQMALDKYVSGLPDGKKNSEEQRAAVLNQLREYTISTLSKIPFPAELKLKSGVNVNGRMIFYQKNLIACGNNGRSEKIPWNELPINDYINIVLYYITIKEEAAAGEIIPESEVRTDCADLYFKLAVLCDWINDYKRACEFIKKSEKMDKSIENDIRKYILN